MAEITAEMVRKLRERSGLPMMDCKKALTETGGDEEAAMELLRKRGAAAAEKKAGRATGEGRIGAYVDTAKGAGALVEVLCETAPVANNPLFRELADKLARQAAATGTSDAAALLEGKLVEDPSMTGRDLLHDVLNRLRENIQVNRVVYRAGGGVATYVHHTGKIGVIVVTEQATSNTELLNDVCMHIAALQPDALTREQIPAATVEKEKEIAREQILASGKPANMVEKILEGKINRWYSERVLLEQPFVKDDKQTVAKVLEAAKIKLTDYVRLQVGC
ncbi:MAG TPA: translation elongation factor Ts [Phycisphaerae bacterium]|nr:translation elongation factor Ts [Phycisphaerae bacterium]HOJ73889.1 translation elongation factor Ts [Phycisphaerae bacterium]HOM50830.1 translation elongation factor Ts [Phycisphaerae bacterium]HON68897.1 translation elongation factor Ts [Phycisphaerae bacterium]HOQ87402.1 translation elongation factor Ts [Phycisphaerae bacterium]